MIFGILTCIAFPIISYTAWGQITGYWQTVDICPATNGNFWVTRVSTFDTLQLISSSPQYLPSENQIALIDSAGNTLWSMGGFAIPHSLDPLPNGNLLVSDCEHDQVVAVAYPSGNITWQWQPSQINWTAVNPAWGPTYYYNNPIPNDWTHVNNAVWFNHTTWIGVSISLRNWNLVVEVNYTADVVNPNQASHIYLVVR